MNHTIVYNKSLSLKEVVQVLDDGGIGLVSFVDEDGKLVGILTDGDLRRGILNCVSDIDELINFDPIKMNASSSRSEVITRLKALHRRHMPLVEVDNTLSSVFSLDDVDFISRPNTIVVMAGGLGSRLGELTKDKPKPMLEVGDKPILQHIVEQFRDQGFHRFIFCLNYKREVIEKYFGNGQKFGVMIDYIFEEQRLGTAGALSLIESSLEHPFFVINADVLTNMDFNAFLDFHISNGSCASMCVRQFKQQIPYGVINTDIRNEIKSIEEKPVTYFKVNAGIYILEPSVMNQVPSNTFYDMPTLFESLVHKKEKVYSFQVHDYWLDIGQQDDYRRANLDMQVIDI